MFVSLNKKFIYTILSFFVITSTIFLWTFYITYDKKFDDELEASLSRNEQYLNTLMENINLRKKLNIRVDEKKVEKEKDYIQRNIEEYNSRYSTTNEAIKIVSFSSVLLLLTTFLLWVLIRVWIIFPINKLSEASLAATKGNLNIRVKKNVSVFEDELDTLVKTFNNMLGVLQSNISTIKSNACFLQDLIDAIPDAIRVIDKKNNIILANKAYFNLVNIKSLSKHKFFESTKGEKVKEAYQPFELIEEAKNKEYNIIQYWDGEIKKHVSINAAQLKVDKKLCVVESIRDLSADIKFSHQQKLSSLGFMATSVAHEMKNNIGAIKLILETILENNNTEIMNLLYKQIVESMHIPEMLLKLSRKENQEQESINVTRAIKEVIDVMDYEAKRNGVKIIATKEDNVYIMANEADFRMLIINLVSNAIKATRKKNGTINIEIKTNNKNAIIEICDNGVGIEKEDINKIFEPFYSQNQDKGTGLGLSIVKSIVNSFGGEINVKSKIGVGTSFKLTFKKIKV